MTNKTTDLYKIQTTREFFNSLLSTYKNAKDGDTLWAQSMLFEPGPYLSGIVESLCRASNLGANVFVLIDSFGILTTNEISTSSTLKWKPIDSKIQALSKEKQRLLSQLKNAGVNLKISGSTNKLKATFPLWFCNHRKSYGKINEKKGIFKTWVTGVNLANESFERQFDIAIESSSEILTKITFTQFEDDFYTRNQTKNKSIFVDYDTNYIIENNSFRSNIISEAYRIIDQAEEYVNFITQYPLDPALLNRVVNSAKKDIEIRILTSEKSDEFNYRIPFKYFDKNFKKQLKEIPTLNRGYFPGKVHAKLLFSEKEALVGSDNITIVGKFLQTKEDMLYIRNNVQYISDLNNFFQKAWDRSSKY